jgi:hypothetical protein
MGKDPFGENVPVYKAAAAAAAATRQTAVSEEDEEDWDEDFPLDPPDARPPADKEEEGTFSYGQEAGVKGVCVCVCVCVCVFARARASHVQ